MRRTWWLAKATSVSWRTRLRYKLQRAVRRYVPDPRDNALNEEPVTDAAYEQKLRREEGRVQVGLRPGQSIEDYMLDRDRKWAERQRAMVGNLMNNQHVPTTKDGMPFTPSSTRAQYMSVEAANQHLKEPTRADYEVDEETQMMRRQLQLENEVEYRKFIAETKRNELTMQETQKRRRPHPSDPNYDPFRITPGYRPQDSVALAQWLKRQRSSGKTANGVSLQTKEGQERFYNEEKMATQYYANPFANRIEIPPGMSKLRITAYSPDSIFVNDKEVIGSCIVTDSTYYHWNVTSFEEINERTLALVLHLYPVPNVLILGTGRNLHMIDEDLRIALQKRGTAVQCMTTPKACGTYGTQVSVAYRSVLAIINPVPTRGYGVECFGDFIENDMFSLSDTELGVSPMWHAPAMLYRQNKVAEKFRATQGTGIGPQYIQLGNGTLVRPGTSGTRLQPMLEPGETVEWEKLPSYYHWYPKEQLDDYIENTTMRELRGRTRGDTGDLRVQKTMDGSPYDKDDTVHTELMPWDSATIPITTFPHERDDSEIIVSDPKTGRVIGMERDTYERWKKMMQERRDGLPESDPVEYDQERYVTSKDGVVFDLTKIQYRPIFQGRWNPRRPFSSGRTNPIMT